MFYDVLTIQKRCCNQGYLSLKGTTFCFNKCVFFKGHHETPLSAPTKILEKFPSNLPKRPENVIPADSEKATIEEVCDENNSLTA